jgi:hypothetical protein
MSCDTSPNCTRLFGYTIQQTDRAAGDSVEFRRGRAIYNDAVNQLTSQINPATGTFNTPVFSSGSDYMRWKRMKAQFASVPPQNQPMPPTCK